MLSNAQKLIQQNKTDITAITLCNVTTGNNFTISPLTHDHLRPCQAIETRVHKELEENGKGHFIKPNSPETYQNMLNDGKIFGVFSQGFLVAYAGLLFPNKVNYDIGRGCNKILDDPQIGYQKLGVLKGARVPKSFQGHGFGLALTAIRMSYATFQGKTHALIKLSAEHVKNIENYQKFGFKKEPKYPIIDPTDNASIYNLVCALKPCTNSTNFIECAQVILDKRLAKSGKKSKPALTLKSTLVA